MFATIKNFKGNVEIESSNNPSIKVIKVIKGTKINNGDLLKIGKDSSVEFTCPNGRTGIKTEGIYGLSDLCAHNALMDNEPTLIEI